MVVIVDQISGSATQTLVSDTEKEKRREQVQLRDKGF